MPKIMDPEFKQRLKNYCGLNEIQIRNLIKANMLCLEDLRNFFKTEEELTKTIGGDIVTIRKMNRILNLNLKSEFDYQSEVINTTNVVFPFWRVVSAVCISYLIIREITLFWNLIVKIINKI